MKCYIISAVLWMEYLQTGLYSYISNSDEIKTPKWSSPKKHLNFSIRSGKSMTSQCRQ